MKTVAALLVVAALAVVSHPAPRSAQAVAPSSFFRFVSAPGDWIGGGRTVHVTPATSSFAVSKLNATNPPGGLGFHFWPGDPIANGMWWNVRLMAPSLRTLQPGTYENATRWPFQSSVVPGMDISGDGRGCNMLTGRFVVLEAVYTPAGDVRRFHATFEQHCESPAAPPLNGEVFFVETIPLDVNADDQVDIVDALCLGRDVAGLPATVACPLPLSNPDINRDNLETIVDALCVARYVAGLPRTTACPIDPAAPAAPAAAPPPVARAVVRGPGGGVALSLSPSSLMLSPDGRTAVDVRLTGSSPAAPAGTWSVKVGYDAGAVRPVACTAPSGGSCDIAAMPGVIQLSGSSSTGLAADAVLASVQFAPVAAAVTASPLSAQAVTVTTTAGQPLAVKVLEEE